MPPSKNKASALIKKDEKIKSSCGLSGKGEMFVNGVFQRNQHLSFYPTSLIKMKMLRSEPPITPNQTRKMIEERNGKKDGGNLTTWWNSRERD
ncbi:MAG: hypothetical protein Q8Q33_02800 [Chlamydiota bacterium]|nr:hypothetical protein [Chlamydiota bacterium]